MREAIEEKLGGETDEENLSVYRRTKDLILPDEGPELQVGDLDFGKLVEEKHARIVERYLRRVEPDWERAEELMHQYRDTPMDLADATLVALAEASGQRTILTLDDDFRVYRVWRGRGHAAFHIVPGD